MSATAGELAPRGRRRAPRRALGGAVRAVRGDADDRARRDRRERRAALDPGRPALLDLEPRVGDQRLPDRLRRPAPAGRAPRRPGRTPQRLPGGDRPVHDRLAAVRPGGQPDAADRRALRPGRRRRNDLRGDPRHDRDDVPGAARAGEGDRRVRVRRLRRRLGRPARRRRDHAVDRLALDLLREHPDRDRHGRVCDAACSSATRASASARARTSRAGY